MTQTLTAEQRRALAESPDEPFRLTDPETKKVYVLVSEDDFAQVKVILDEFHPRDAYAAIDRAFAPGWADPKMDDYDRYEEFKK